MIISNQKIINEARKQMTTELKPYEIQFKKSPRANVQAWIRFYNNAIDAEKNALEILNNEFYGKAKLIAIIDL